MIEKVFRRRTTRILPYVTGLAVAFSLGFLSAGPGETEAPHDLTLTDSLVVDFHDAWNTGDIPGMVRRLQPSAFFKSPFQLRYGREEMAETVLISNPPAFRNIRTTEHRSYATESLAWSIGELVADVYEEGEPTGDVFQASYLYVFTPDEEDAWKAQMLVFHEECR